MRCPSCGSEVTEADAACPRCGAPRPRGGPIEPPTEERARAPGDTEELAPRGRRGRRAPPSAGARLKALGRALWASGWIDACTAASVGFLALLCVGAVLLVAAKLQNPALGAGAAPLSVFTTIVVLALASLGAPVRVGDVEVSALPLGALLAAGGALAWAMRRVLEARSGDGHSARSRQRPALSGAKVGVPFALLTWVGALLFRFRGGVSPVAVGAGDALVLGALWGALFGALGGLGARGRVRDLVLEPLIALSGRRVSLYRGVQAGAAMVALAAIGALGAALVWIVALLARGVPRGFGVGDAAAAAVYLVAFLPNVLTSVVALALGAPLEVGAKVRVGGRALGPLRELSLADWGGGGAPWYLWLLVLIPLLACGLAGMAARRNCEPECRMVMVIGVAAVVFAVTLGTLAALSDARLGAGLVRPRGFAHVAPDTLATAALALLWAGGLGAAGWRIAEAGHDDADGRAREQRATP